MTEVYLHIYDVTNTNSDKANNAVVQINNVFKDRIGLGGIFHCAIQVEGDENEWSFRYCEEGSGVFSCPAGKNPMYTYRERILLGKTSCSAGTVNHILTMLSRDWPGSSYNLLSRNCNRFCDRFCQLIHVPKLPGWVNRIDNVRDTASVIAGTALRHAKTGIAAGSKAAYQLGSKAASQLGAGIANQAPRIIRSRWFQKLIEGPVNPQGNPFGRDKL